MSLVTSCPDCGTVFRVRLEHLTAHRGDVRCGKCSFFFNALDHLTEAATLHNKHISPATSDEHLDLSSEQATLGGSPDEQIKAVAETELLKAIDSTSDIDSVSTAEIASTESVHSDKSGTEIQENLDQESIAIPLESPWTAQADIVSVAPPLPQAPFDNTAPQPTASGQIDFTHTSNSVSQSQGLKPAPSPWSLGALGLALLALCIGQATYFLRTEIVSRYPPSKPYLLKFCELVGCIVELPQHANLLAIDDSDLQQDTEHENVIVLSSTLINRARFTQSYPALELTLTDVYDKPVLRRLFTPGEYLPKGTDVAAGIVADGETHVKLHLDTSGITAAGYRLYVMYPSTS